MSDQANVLSNSTRPLVTALLATLLAVAAWAGWTALLGVTAGVAVLFALGWPRVLSLPAPRGVSVLLAAVAVAAHAAVAATGDVQGVALVTVIGVLGAFGHELARKDGRPRMVESLAGSISGVAVIGAGSGWAALGQGVEQLALVLAAAIGVAVAACLSAIPLPRALGHAVTIGGAGGIGVLVGLGLAPVGWWGGGLIGLAAGMVSAALSVLLSGVRAGEGRLVRPLALGAAAALPVLVLGLPVHVVWRVLF